MNMSLLTFNVPEIPAAGMTLGLTYATAAGTNFLSGLITNALGKTNNPITKVIKTFDDAVAQNVKVYQSQAEEIEQLKSDIISLQRMKANQNQPQQ